jgi:hypothetical protein
MIINHNEIKKASAAVFSYHSFNFFNSLSCGNVDKFCGKVFINENAKNKYVDKKERLCGYC